MTTLTEKLTGQALLDYVHENPLLNHTERCKGAGYFKKLEDGNISCNYIEFFEAVMDARKANGEYQEPPQSNADWYDNLTDQDRELYDQIEDMCPEFTKLTAEECQEFMDELSENGITTAEQFENAYYYQSDSYRAEREFAEYVVTEVNSLDVPSFVYNHIDWEAVWNHELSYDFFTIVFDGETYFFHNNF